MKNLFCIVALAVLAGCSTVGSRVELADIDAGANLAETNAFADYGRGMASDAAHPMAVEWQNANDAKIAEATSAEALLAIVDGEGAAEALLAKVCDAYRTDPLVAIQMAAVTQLVMDPKLPNGPARRWRWASALVTALKSSVVPYRSMCFLDQLRWCGYLDQANDIRLICAQQGNAAVRDFGDMVVRELKASR